MVSKKINAFFADYGRTAIRLVYQYILDRNGKHDIKVLAPTYVCDSVLYVFSRETILSYELKDAFEIEEDFIAEQINSGALDDGILYLAHYFGKIAPQRFYS